MRVLLIALALTSSAAWASGVTAQSDIQGFTLNRCNTTRSVCVTAASPLATGSFLRPLYTFESLNVKFDGKKQHRQWKAAHGWFDLQLNQLVVTEKTKEYVIDLDELTLNETDVPR